MKLAFVLPGVARHAVGGYKIVYQYAAELASRGHSVTVLHSRYMDSQPSSPSLWRRIKNLSLLPEVVANSRPRWHTLCGEIRVINLLRARLSDLAEYDVIVATGVTTADYVYAAADRYGARGLYFIQGFEDWVYPAAEVDRTWRLSLERVVIAPWLLDHARSLGVEAHLVANAVDSVEFPRGPAIHARPSAVAAMISPQPLKRADLLCEMFARVHQEAPEVLGLAYGVASRPKELPDYVRYLRRPTHRDLVALYQTARVFVCSSDFEGFGLPPAEAMISGAALVSTCNPGVASYATGCARLVDVGDAHGLASATLELLADPVTNEDLANRGAESLSTHSLSQAARRFAEVVEATSCKLR